MIEMITETVFCNYPIVQRTNWRLRHPSCNLLSGSLSAPLRKPMPMFFRVSAIHERKDNSFVRIINF